MKTLLNFLMTRSLKSRVTLFALAIFLLCVWALAFYGRGVMRDTMQRSLGEQQLSTAAFIAAGVNHELEDRLRALEAGAAAMAPAVLGDAAALQAMLDRGTAFHGLFAGRAFAAGPDGIVTAAAPLLAEGGGERFIDAGVIAAALSGHRAAGRPAAGTKAGTTMVALAVPLRDARGKVIGALGAVSELGSLGTLAAYGDGKAGAFRLVARGDRLARGADGSTVVFGPDGVEMLIARKTVPLAGWVVELSVPNEEAFAPFHAARRRMLLATIALSVLAAGLTWLMLRGQLAPLLAASRKLAAHSDGDEPVLSLAVGRQDEIGDLIASFNRLLETLRQRQDALTASEERFRCLSQMSADFYWESDATHRLTQRTESRREIDEMVFRQTSSLGFRRWEMPSISPDEAGWQAHRAMLGAHLPFRHFEISRLGANGAARHVTVSGDPVFDQDGNFTGYHGVGADITERKQTELALIASEQRLAAVLDGVQSAVVTITGRGVVESFNQSAVQMFGYSAAEVIGQNVNMLMAQPYRGEHDGYLDNYERTGVQKIIGRRREVLAQRKDGSSFPIELGVFETVLNERKFFIGSISDISFRKKAEAELRIAATAFESLQGMLITDADGVILRVNQAFTDITGYTSAEVIGQTPRLLKSGRHGADFYGDMWETIARTGGWQGEIWDRRKNGEIYPKWLTITAVKDEDGVVTHYVGAHFDITERKRKEEQVRQLAFYDTLTELPNRRLLSERLGQAMVAGKRNGSYGALLFLDLDNFKSLNDTHGHAVGDLLLIEAARRLQHCVRAADTVARFGGDELVVMLSQLNGGRDEAASHARLVAEKIRASLSQPYLLTVEKDGAPAATVEHCCTASIGVALFGDQAAGQDDILKGADAAMYEAKQGGGNAICFDQAGWRAAA